MKILVAIDGSPQALAALETLAGKFDFFRDPPSLLLLNVHLPVAHKAATAWVGKEAVENYYREEGEAALADAVAFLNTRGVPFRAERRIGDPADEIAKLASSEHCDLIAMGTHGHGALATLVLGSVANKVLAVSEVPVLLMK